MSAFRFIHSSDLHLGRRFGSLPEEARPRLVEARHAVIARLAAIARDRGARHVLIAGDIFDSETPTDGVWRQARAAMAADPSVRWWLIPGNHDSLAAESLWRRFRDGCPANVTLIADPEPIEIEPGVILLPCPLTRRRPGRDLTDWTESCDTDPQALRIGLAHGAIQGFGGDDDPAEGIIPPDRARRSRLDYLALGDWHGQMRIDDRCWYSGTPERDGFRHDGRGMCLAVEIAAPGATPLVERVECGAFAWAEEVLPLVPGQSAAEALSALLPTDRAARRDQLIRVRAHGRASLADQAALGAAARDATPEFCHFALETTALMTDVEPADLDEIDHAGALRIAAERLATDAADEARDAAARRISAAALGRLYGYLQEDRG